MSHERLSGEALCKAFMDQVCKDIYGGAKRQVDYLRFGPKNRVDEDMERHILSLSSLQLTEQQRDAL